MADNLGIGTRVNHPKFGEGIVAASDLSGYTVFFKSVGDKEISREFSGMEVIALAEPPEDSLTLDDVERALTGVLQRLVDFPMLVPLGDKWRNGKMILQPADKSLQGKELPIDTFFHKIVMLRDRLRVLEQNINSNATLSDEEKVNLQQYITRIYGTLTTFNVLFARKEDQFKGESKS